MKKSNTDINRRQFLKNGAVAVAALGAVGVGVNYLKHFSEENNNTLLRPPGAVDENDFIYACIKCGLCVQICPVEAIKLASISDGLSYGTPYINTREQACDFSCDAMQCVETCPTAALDFLPFKNAGENALIEFQKENKNPDADHNPFIVQSLAMKATTKMGIAVTNHSTCLAQNGKSYKGVPREEGFKGVYRSPDPKRKERKASPVNDHQFDRELCNLCVTECPIGETAIIMESKTRNNGETIWRPIVLDGCTGCGVCEMVCPTTPSSIVIEKLERA